MNSHEKDRKMKAIEEMERELAQPLSHFRGAVKALAERGMSQMPRVVLRAEKKPVWRTVRVHIWAPASVLLLLLVVGLVKSDHGMGSQSASNSPSVAQVEQSPAPQQVSDSALMTEVDEDLTQNAPTPLEPLEVATTSQTHTNNTQAEDTDGVEP